jgi:predicted DNA-binding protein
MNTPKFEIPVKKYTGASTVVSFRLPKDMLRDVDEVAAHTGRTRNEVLSLCVEFALEHLDPGEASEDEAPADRSVRIIKLKEN